MKGKVRQIMVNGIVYLRFCFKVINIIEENFPHEYVLVRKKESNCMRSVSSGFII